MHTSLAIAIPVLDNGIGELIMGPEAVVTDFALLTDNGLENLPSDFTICSSVASRAILSGTSPFQLLYQNGEPWISFYFKGPSKDSTRHGMLFHVSRLYL